MKVKIKENSALSRDKETGAIINTSKSDYDKALINRNKRLKDKERLNNLEDSVKNLDDKLNKILELLNAD